VSANLFQINWFSATVEPREIPLRYASFSSRDQWDKVSHELPPESYRRQVVRHKTGRPVFQVVSLVSKPSGGRWDVQQFDLLKERAIGQALLHLAAAAHFREKGCTTSIGRFNCVFALRRVPLEDQHDIELLNGVVLKAYQPIRDETFGFIIQWKVRAQFTRNLEDRRMRQLAIGNQCILRFSGSPPEDLPQELTTQNERSIGRVVKIEGSTAHILRNDRVFSVPIKYLFLEAKPALIRDFEAAFRTRLAARSAWRDIQMLTFSLTRDGKRNSRALADRMQAIRKFLSSDGASQITFPLTVDRHCLVSVATEPATVGLGRLM
jgi:hypothetical protein